MTNQNQCLHTRIIIHTPVARSNALVRAVLPSFSLGSFPARDQSFGFATFPKTPTLLESEDLGGHFFGIKSLKHVQRFADTATRCSCCSRLRSYCSPWVLLVGRLLRLAFAWQRQSSLVWPKGPQGQYQGE